MDDSDEYFDDSFVLDEATLASIQATEERFGASLSQARPTPPAPPPRIQASTSPPPSKRLKTCHGSFGPAGSLRVVSVPPRPVLIGMESSDLNPEIRVGPDGNYVVSSQYTAQMNVASNNGGHMAMEQSLREAQDALLVKAGEVTILRQTIEKTKKEYAEVVAKAKAEMIAHEKVKVELQAKLKEETERMATRLVFQQHQMETSTRKPSLGSVRPRRMVKNPAMTVVETPTHVQSAFPLPSTSRSVRRTTRLRSHLEGYSGPLSSPTNAEYRAEVKQPQFKGFHNTFIHEDPVITKSPANDRDESPEENRRSDPFLTPIKAKNTDVYVRDLGSGNEIGTEVDGQARSDWWEERDAQTEELGGTGEDIVMAVNQSDTELSLRPVGRMNEGVTCEDELDCSEELRRIVFTHVAPRNNELTLHILFSTGIPQETSTEKQAYMAACQIILQTCGARHARTQDFGDSEWEATVIRKVANAFTILVDILGRTGCLASLTALLDLLVLLTLYVPAFISPFLGLPNPIPIAGHQDSNNSLQLFPILCNIVRDHLVPPKGDARNIDENESVRENLAIAVVQLMESLCWSAQPEMVDQLGVLSRQPQVFDILLDPAQPRDMIARALQLLVLLTTQPDMVRCLFSSYESDNVNNRPSSPSSRDASRISIVEQLCHYLVEPAVQESYRIRHLTIALITILADSNIEARTILLDSASLAPSLVISVTNLSRLLWEDDISNMDTPELAKLTVDLLYSTVNLLHRLVFVLNLSSVLGRKLIEATRLPGPFNGVTHMFVVTFGRLSWAEGPDWLEDECKDKCEVIAELAMEIIETVVAGPECDSLWAVWHKSEVADEEELEEWTIQVD